jgi:hypothetical protein
MGREVRRVPANWQHPKAWNAYRGEMAFVPLYEANDYAERAAEWDEEFAKWREGLERNFNGWEPIGEEHRNTRYSDYAGERPSPDDYMPDWPAEQRTHYMMYENTSEGTPISPAFATPEELARWLTDNNASAFGGEGASYDAWLRVARGGFAPSAVLCGGVMQSGVEALARRPTLPAKTLAHQVRMRHERVATD